MTEAERIVLRRIISDTRRGQLVEAGHCKWCLAELPETTFRGNQSARRRMFCSKNCWWRWKRNEERQQRMVAA
jgi:hypothetical protein